MKQHMKSTKYKYVTHMVCYKQKVFSLCQNFSFSSSMANICEEPFYKILGASIFWVRVTWVGK